MRHEVSPDTKEQQFWVLVPVKPFASAKTRLAFTKPFNNATVRSEFARATYHDLIESLSHCRMVDRIAVITSETALLNQPSNDILVLEEQGSELNQAVSQGLKQISSLGATRCAIIPADIPLASAEDIDSAIQSYLQFASNQLNPSIAIMASSNDGGTNFLALDPSTDFICSYGPDSYRQHLNYCQAKNLATLTLDKNSLSIDIDKPEDLVALMQTVIEETSPAEQTKAFFNKHQVYLSTGFWSALGLNAPIDSLCSMASEKRDRAYGNILTYSRKVFIPLTHLCRDVCHYCTFAKSPKKVASAYLSASDVLDICSEGVAAGCKEALITLGERPELRYNMARKALADMGFASTIDYVTHIASLIADKTGLLPHINAGNLTIDEIKQLKPHAPSIGIMLENVSPRLCEKGQPHYGSPDKDPITRLATLENAGKALVPTTTGILIGIGETRDEVIDSLLAIAALQHRYGHIQEVIVQNFVPKEATKMAGSEAPDLQYLRWALAMARLILPAAVSLQVPPNLNTGKLADLISAGINDWGGVSPVTPDHVNPESPWPALQKLDDETRQAGKLLQQRLTIYPRFIRHDNKQDCQQWVDKKANAATLKLMDSEGLARQDAWLSGVSKQLPNQLREQVFATPSLLKKNSIGKLLDHLCENTGNQPIALDDIVSLFQARGEAFSAVCTAADHLREKAVGDTVTYVVNRNINYTNICTYRCEFCAFSKGKKNSQHADPAYLKTPATIAQLASEAVAAGATEVCLQGGIHPKFTGQDYLDICAAVHTAQPDLHIHAFSPLEIWHGANSLGLSIEQFLQQLKAVGLKSLPGTAAEILVDAVRDKICPDKIRSQQWLDVIATAHKIELPTTATIMFGHVDSYSDWAEHLLRIRDLQLKTGGFTEFVPLPFVAHEAPIYKRGKARRGPTLREAVLMHAVSRLVFNGLIDNIQTSWVKMGLEGAKLCINAGANDMGGVLMNESITRAAGASHGQQVDQQTLISSVIACRREPKQRTTLYKPTESVLLNNYAQQLAKLSAIPLMVDAG